MLKDELRGKIMKELALLRENTCSYLIYDNNESKFKKSVPTWNEKFELLKGSYTMSDIQNYFKIIFKNMKQ